MTHSTPRRVRILLHDFAEAFDSDQVLPTGIKAIMVVSAAPDLSGVSRRERERSPENVSRLEFAARLWWKNGEDPFFIVNGETEQLPMMVDEARRLLIPESSIYQMNSGDRGASNTKTQFTVLREDPRVEEFFPLLVVTNRYHVPRVRRTAARWLPRELPIYVFAVPSDDLLWNDLTKISGEVRRILEYAAMGDIAR